MEYTKTIVIRLPMEVKKELKMIGKKEGKSVSKIVRKAIDEYIVLIKKGEMGDIFAQ